MVSSTSINHFISFNKKVQVHFGQNKTVKNYLINDEGKDGYCFKSTVSKANEFDGLVSQIVNYNSTITEADAAAFLKALNTVVMTDLQNGESVQLPFCSIRPYANGTCPSIESMFSPGEENNKIIVHIDMTKEAKLKITQSIQYKQVESTMKSDPEIKEITSLLPNATESKNLEVKTGARIRLRGSNLSIDLTDDNQRVYFETETESVEVAEYHRIGSSIVDIVVPKLSAGTYNVSIRTKPGMKRYKRDTIENAVVIVE